LQINPSGGWLESYRRAGIGNGNLSASATKAGDILSWCNRLWLLKNSFPSFQQSKFVRRLLNVRSPKAQKFAEITALVPFSTATPDFAN